MFIRIAARGLAASLVLTCASWSPAPGIIMRHDRADGEYRTLGSRYPAVGAIARIGEGTLVAPEWVVTAAHVAEGIRDGQGVVFGDEAYLVRDVHIYPGRGAPQDDIALIRLQRPVEGITPVPLYAGRDELGQEVVFVGRGGIGNGETGPTGEDRVLRGATNQVAAVRETLLIFEFDSGEAATNLEGISGPGDSGGPAFIDVGGVTYVAGISSGQDHSGPGREGIYGVKEFYTRVSSYLDWLNEKIQGGGSRPASPEKAQDGGQESGG